MPVERPRATPVLSILATVGAVLVQAKVTLVTVTPLASWAVAENACTWLGEMEAVFGEMVMVAILELALECPPQAISAALRANKDTRTRAHGAGGATVFDRMMVKDCSRGVRASGHVDSRRKNASPAPAMPLATLQGEILS